LPTKTEARPKVEDMRAGVNSAPDALAHLPVSQIVGAYTNALSARLIDSKILILLRQGKVFFHIGCSGHEVAQVAVALAMRPGHDWAYPYYRDLAFWLHDRRDHARGASPQRRPEQRRVCDAVPLRA
jgi:TPP-dependent pyruvate/acetoin dehydrogenase alpha subunit